MNKIVIALLFIFLLTGCYEQKISVRRDLKGTISYNITLNKSFYNFIKSINKEETSISFNEKSIVSKKFIDEKLSEESDVVLSRFTNKNTEDSSLYFLRLNYTNIEDIPDFLPSKYFKTYIFKEKKTTVIRTVLTLGFLGDSKKIKNYYKSLNKEDKKYLDVYAKKVKLKFEYTLFSRMKSIDSVIIPRVSKDKKKLLFELTLYDILISKLDPEIQIFF